jgi:hypothetical protein
VAAQAASAVRHVSFGMLAAPAVQGHMHGSSTFTMAQCTSAASGLLQARQHQDVHTASRASNTSTAKRYEHDWLDRSCAEGHTNM